MIVRVATLTTIVVVVVGGYCVLPHQGEMDVEADRHVERVPTDPQCLPFVRSTLKRLADYSAATDRILSGQNVGHASDDLLRSHYRTWVRLTQFRDQPAPAVMGLDLGLNEIPSNASPLLQLVLPHCESGGLVSLSMHPRNPWTGGDYHDLQVGDIDDLFRSGSAAHRRWRKALDQAASILKLLQEKRVCVLWRPLHEANGYWFWWCGGGQTPSLTPTQFKQLWREMRVYFEETHGLHNLVWVYAANAKTDDRVRSPLDFYPGDTMVDVVGLDYYGDDIGDLNEGHAYQQLLDTGKPIALTEFGALPANGRLNTAKWLATVQRRYPHLAYFVFWHSWPKNLVSLADLDGLEAIMQSGGVHHRE